MDSSIVKLTTNASDLQRLVEEYNTKVEELNNLLAKIKNFELQHSYERKHVSADGSVFMSGVIHGVTLS